jgi:hypothetical protein
MEVVMAVSRAGREAESCADAHSQMVVENRRNRTALMFSRITLNKFRIGQFRIGQSKAVSTSCI